MMPVSLLTRSAVWRPSFLLGREGPRNYRVFRGGYQDNCIQCNQCAYICPHAAIRPFVLTDEELTQFDCLETLEMKAPAAMKGMHFVIEPSVLDCLGCGRSNLFACQSKNCADICPGNPKLGKALTMVPFNPDTTENKKMAADWDKLVKVPSKQDLVDIRSNVKNSQFAQPLFEFSGACSGSLQAKRLLRR